MHSEFGINTRVYDSLGGRKLQHMRVSPVIPKERGSEIWEGFYNESVVGGPEEHPSRIDPSPSSASSSGCAWLYGESIKSTWRFD